jgi:hypothetical protein
MEKLLFLEKDVKFDLVYEGTSFTITRAVVEYNGRRFVGEGVSRRSWQDAPNPELGQSISHGRAVKALIKKIKGEKIHHNLMG